MLMGITFVMNMKFPVAPMFWRATIFPMRLIPFPVCACIPVAPILWHAIMIARQGVMMVPAFFHRLIWIAMEIVSRISIMIPFVMSWSSRVVLILMLATIYQSLQILCPIYVPILGARISLPATIMKRLFVTTGVVFSMVAVTR